MNSEQQPDLSVLNMYGLEWEVNERGEKFMYAPNFLHPFTCMVSGPTGCGKSTFVAKLIERRHDKIYPPPDKIVWCYSEWQPLYNTLLHGVEFHQGLPQNLNPEEKTLVILDDLMTDINGDVSELFTKGSHHRNISIIHIVQNLFHQGKEHRTISLNCNYMVIFKNPRDASQINYLSKQMHPGEASYMSEVYRDATKKPYGYLLVDYKQETEENLRLRTNVLDTLQYIYVRK
jgi:GTPase SAR1 family protein